MNLNELSAVSPAKVQALLARIKKLNIDLTKIEETFVRGGGKGGQKINKTANAVQLHYAPLGLVVRVQKERQRNINRFLALRELVDQIEMEISPRTSERLKEWAKIKKQKGRRARRGEQARKPQDSGGVSPSDTTDATTATLSAASKRTNRTP